MALNRNFQVYWGQGGSSGSPCDYQVYRGPSAFSEPETRNIRWLAEQFPGLRIAVDCHSSGETIYRPQPTGGSFIAAEPISAADDIVYQSLEATINAAIGAVNPGKSYSTGTTSNHSGTTDEYLFFAHRIFAFDLECALDFQPPISSALVSVHVGAFVRAPRDSREGSTPRSRHLPAIADRASVRRPRRSAQAPRDRGRSTSQGLKAPSPHSRAHLP